MTGIKCMYQYLLFIQSFLKRSLLEKSCRLLKFTAEVLNFSLGFLLGRRINYVRKDHGILLLHLQSFCKFLGGSFSCLLQVGDTWWS